MTSPGRLPRALHRFPMMGESPLHLTRPLLAKHDVPEGHFWV